MSLILDALNRAEHERKNQNTVPDINTLHRPQALNAEAGARRTLWWAIGAVLVLIAIILALLVVLRRESGAVLVSAPPSTVTPSASVPQPVVEQAPVVVQAPAVAPAASAQPPAASTTVAAAPAVVADTAARKSVTNADVDKLYAAEDPATPAPVDTGVNELYAAEAATTAASETIVDPFNSTGSATATAQEQAPPRTFDSIKNIPDFNALPWNMRQKIPTITYARHNYLAGGVSSVVINNQTTGVGNIIGTGQFIVQEIYVDGVVLKHGNAVFKLRALTGWINM